MSKPSLSILIGLFIGFILNVSAQPPQKQPGDPTTNPRKQKVEDNRALIDWADADVGPIITEPERRAYKMLRTNEERENFIAHFWDSRDPNPDTAENEYREEYYGRLEYANEHFSSGIPGWKSDRGRIYIRWGKPDEIESHPSGVHITSPDIVKRSRPTLSRSGFIGISMDRAMASRLNLSIGPAPVNTALLVTRKKRT